MGGNRDCLTVARQCHYISSLLPVILQDGRVRIDGGLWLMLLELI